jgi:hypothetical protein
VGLADTLRELIAKEQEAGRKKKLGAMDVRAHERSILAGAIGAALLGAYRYEQLQRRGKVIETTGAA